MCLTDLLEASHHEFEVGVVVAFARRGHEERGLVVALAVEAVPSVEHEDLEGGDSVLGDEGFEFVDVLGHHRG